MHPLGVKISMMAQKIRLDKRLTYLKCMDEVLNTKPYSFFSTGYQEVIINWYLMHPSFIYGNSKKSHLLKHDRKVKKIFSYVVFPQFPESS